MAPYAVLAAVTAGYGNGRSSGSQSVQTAFPKNVSGLASAHRGGGSAPVRLHTAAGLSEILTPFPFNHAFPCEPIAKCKGKIKKVKDKEKNGFSE